MSLIFFLLIRWSNVSYFISLRLDTKKIHQYDPKLGSIRLVYLFDFNEWTIGQRLHLRLSVTLSYRNNSIFFTGI